MGALLRFIALEKTKIAVEIVALLVGGTWALWEHVIQTGQARARREGYSWATATLNTKTISVSPSRFLLHATITLKNTSQRLVEPLFAGWVVEAVDDTGKGTTAAPTQVTHRIAGVEPGEESVDAVRFVLDKPTSALLLRVKVYLKSPGPGEECMVDESRPAPGHLPNVCVSDNGSGGGWRFWRSRQPPTCKRPTQGCRYVFSEALIEPPAEKPSEARTPLAIKGEHE
jgi:hypothetical protein